MRSWIQSNLTVRESRDPNQFEANCPFCHTQAGGKAPDTKYHLGISLKPGKQVCHCFRCGYRGSLLKLIRDMSGVSYAEARVLVGIPSGPVSLHGLLKRGDRLGKGTPEKVAENRSDEDILPRNCQILGRKSYLHRRPWEYLRERGVSEEIIKDYELGFCITGDNAQRIIIPIRFDEELVGYVGRTVDEDEPKKYKFPSGFKAAQYVFNYDRAQYSHFVILMEGVFDVWRAPDHAVALFSNRMSVEQKRLIVDTWETVVVMLDRDAGDYAYAIYRELSRFTKCSVALLRSKDPWEASQKEFLGALVAAGKGLGALLK